MFETKKYFYSLPEELIASEPLAERDASRLLIVHRTARRIEHKKFKDLPECLDPNYRLVANNTKVFRARLIGKRKDTDGKIEFFMLERLGPKTWKGLMRSAARVTPGFEFVLGESTGRRVNARVIAREENPAGVLLTAEFSDDPAQLELGEVPLPPYIVSRMNPGLDHRAEIQRYNTAFAKIEGSVAAPTAGRHFTEAMISALRARGIPWDELTLHVGLGTFKPVTVSDVREHEMHAEEVQITEALANDLNAWKRDGKKILAIGTTSTRALEGRVDPVTHQLIAGNGRVRLFIHPGSHHRWRFVDAMLTNFHLPESTLLMMVADFVGDLEWVHAIYQEAIRERYRFYSYGDAMLILP